MLLATAADAKKAERGFEAQVLGYLEYDPTHKVIMRFDVVAQGDHWGESDLTQGARAGRQPLGVAFVLGRADKAADTVPPQAARDYNEYMGK